MGCMPEKGNRKADFSDIFLQECFLIYLFAEGLKREDYIIPVFSLGMFVMLFMLVYRSFHKLSTTSKKWFHQPLFLSTSFLQIKELLIHSFCIRDLFVLMLCLNRC